MPSTDAPGGAARARGELSAIELRHPSGAHAVVVTQGAHVIEWRPAGGAEALFLGESAEFARGRTIRGGIPIVFPQFAELGPLPKHGIVRTLPWTVEVNSATDATLVLESSRATRALWPHDFTLAAHVRLTAHALIVALEVRNTGAGAFEFTGGLHTYIRVAALPECRVRGLAGHTYLDKTRNGTRRTDESAELKITSETDRVYEAAPEVQLLDPGNGRALSVSASGFSNLVIWNPGADRVLEFSGLGPDDFRRFVCIEPAVVTAPMRLEPGRTWRGTQELGSRPFG